MEEGNPINTTLYNNKVLYTAAHFGPANESRWKIPRIPNVAEGSRKGDKTKIYGVKGTWAFTAVRRGDWILYQQKAGQEQGVLVFFSSFFLFG